jgi:phytoene dehydrogenase-like protein
MYDTIIIGAGMSGLAAGIRLAHFGQRVCILERHTTIGGLNSFYRLRGRNYDVGLHAVTNYTPRGTKHGPLARLLRQLRFRWDEFDLSQQLGSAIAFPNVRLEFNNDVELLTSEIASAFPQQKDNFQRLLGRIADYDDIDQAMFEVSAREVVAGEIDDPLLVEMLFCPLMWYGNAREHDMDWGQFCIMFRSIYLEGFARPIKGVRLILKKLVRRFRELGGELKLRCGVKEIRIDGETTPGVVLDDGAELTARRVLSSAGWPETLRLCSQPTTQQEAGQMSFVEAVCTLDCLPAELDHQETIVFFNDSDKFHWQRCGDLCDTRTGVVCSPNNFDYPEEEIGSSALPEGVIRLTAIADHEGWRKLDADTYVAAKQGWYDRLTASAVRFVPDFRPRVIETDMFTPNTVRRFTWKENGAVYGAPQKRLAGTTHLKNLFICGTDQGYVGIIGAIISGITVANRHLLTGDL